jgi:hypothetical protein
VSLDAVCGNLKSLQNGLKMAFVYGHNLHKTPTV